MKKKYPKLIGAIHLVALIGSGKYKVCEEEEAEYFANVKFWDKDDEQLRGDFQVFINPPTPISSMKKEIDKKITDAIKEILKPFVYNKYGKTYIGHKETEGALRIEGLILQLEKVLRDLLTPNPYIKR